MTKLAVAAAELPELELEGPNAAKRLHAMVVGVYSGMWTADFTPRAQRAAHSYELQLRNHPLIRPPLMTLTW